MNSLLVSNISKEVILDLLEKLIVDGIANSGVKNIPKFEQNPVLYIEVYGGVASVEGPCAGLRVNITDHDNDKHQ